MSENESPEIESHGISRPGKVRHDNQDAIRFCRPDDLTRRYGPLYAIADGMGGYAHGGVASSLALEHFFDTFYKSNGVSLSQKLRLGVQDANVGIYQTAQRLGVPRMGTTLTAVNLTGRTLNIVHVGDSRAYLVRGGGATCLTNDHTRVGEMVRLKMLSPDKVRSHAQRSVLNKCLGVGLFVQPDILQVPLEPGDVVILCTDGVWSVVEDAEFALMAADSPGPEDLSRRIYELAMSRESDDNLSVIALYIRRLPEGAPPDSSTPPWTMRVLRRILSRRH
ncbi:MAG TPA: protein phosphatase 2C domain-containing protein [Bacteroidota bacterium]|nr:protein phosphatase 2C domain-containing protein [Bacteroidota bacterium]